MSVEEHYNKAARVPPPRNFMRDRRVAHNSVKWACFRQAVAIGTGRVPYRVLDLACGRGGDFVKHARSLCCAAYYGVDIADDALTELERRAKECPGIPSMHLACMDPGNLGWKHVDADVCTLNFAMHYFCDSEQHLNLLMRTVATYLRHGGIFCGTYFDYRCLPKCADAAVEGAWPSEKQLRHNPYGHKYHYKMGRCVDAPEYVVHFPTICKIASMYGLYLSMDRSFDCYMTAHLLQHGVAQAGQRVFMFRKCPLASHTQLKTPR